MARVHGSAGRSPRRLLVGALLCAVAGTGLLAPVAHADPGCQNGGALVMWARGSDQTFREPIFTSFYTNVGSALGSIAHQDVELGNIDGNFQVDEAREYPAVTVLKVQLPSAYFNSREIGINELVAFLNTRATRCPHEAVIIGGFSQGADVVGAAILREGYGALSAQAKRQIAVVAQYGDPSHFGGRGMLAPGRARPAFLLNAGRIGSWCDVNDFICNFHDPGNFPWGNSHGHIYRDRYIPDTSRWIADLARSKIDELRPAPTPLPVPTATPLATLPLIRATVREQQGRFGAGTFAGTNASGPGPRIGAAQWVDVSCKVHDPAIASANPDGYWYRIASAPWNDGYYAAANTFMNGDPWGGPYSHPTDLAVPTCAGAAGTTPPPPPPPAAATYPETTGGPTNTWTNPANAGGTQGPTIPANTTVQIACKLTGFRVANGNTWWYRIASSPWNGAYHSSADAFFNNGQTSGSLVGTPWVDPNVPAC